MNETPTTGAKVMIVTKPFVDSDRYVERTVRYLGSDNLHWLTERKPGSRHFVPKSTIISWEEI